MPAAGHVLTLAQLAEVRVKQHESVRRAEVQRVVDAPVHLCEENYNQQHTPRTCQSTRLTDLARRVKEALKRVAEEHAGAERDAHRLDGLHDRADDVRRRLEAVRPDEVHEVHHRVLAAEASNAEGEVLDDDAGCLAMDEVAVREGVLEHRDHRVDVVRGLWADVLEDECKRLQTTRAYVELGGTVFVEDCGDTRER